MAQNGDEMHITEVATHKARKAHRCEWCGQRIDEGTEYKRYRYCDGGDAATVKMHPECMAAMQDEGAYWGCDFEWTPGYQERPTPPSPMEYRKIKFGERLEEGDERLRPSGGSCCHPGGWFPIPKWEAGEKRSHGNAGMGLRRPIKRPNAKVQAAGEGFISPVAPGTTGSAAPEPSSGD